MRVAPRIGATILHNLLPVVKPLPVAWVTTEAYNGGNFVMRNLVFIKPIFWRVLFWGLVIDWGSKLLANLFIDPMKFPRPPISELEGKVYPHPPGSVSVANAEHWHDHWYDVDGLFLKIYNLVEDVTPFDFPMVAFFLIMVIGVPLLFSISSIRQRHFNVWLAVGLALWFVAFIGNKGEILLFGHVTDWIWLRIWGMSMFTNLADGMAVAALVILSIGQKPEDSNESPNTMEEEKNPP